MKKICLFCNSEIDLCQICGYCEHPICYSCLEKYWVFNKEHNVVKILTHEIPLVNNVNG